MREIRERREISTGSQGRARSIIYVPRDVNERARGRVGVRGREINSSDPPFTRAIRSRRLSSRGVDQRNARPATRARAAHYD